MEQTGTYEVPGHIHPIIYSLRYYGLEGHDNVPHYLITINDFLDIFEISEPLKSETKDKLERLKTKLDNLPKRVQGSFFPGPYYSFGGEAKNKLLKYLESTNLSLGADGMLDDKAVRGMNRILQELLEQSVAGGRRKTRRRRRASRRKSRHVGKKH
jgi:hypothetical protein